MQWLTDLFKQVTVSKPLTGACLLTTTWILFGNHFFPTLTDQVPSQWRWIVVIAFVFSASLLLIWYLPPFVSWIWAAINTLPWFDRLTEEELRFLKYASTQRDYIYLNEIVKFNPSQSKIALLVVTTRLIKMGYLRKINYDENHLALTEKGRKFVFKKHRGALA